MVMMALTLLGAELVRMSCRRQLLKPVTVRQMPAAASGVVDAGR